MKRKEEEIIQKKLKKRIKLEIQEMGILSIISKKPKVNNSCQHLGSIMILPKEKKNAINIAENRRNCNIISFY